MARSTVATPRVSPQVARWFAAYSRYYLRKHFHAFRVSLLDLPAGDPGGPLVLYANHASWWDPLTLLLVTRHWFPGRSFCAPFEEKALHRYRIFERLGCFAVEQGTARGARQFLRASRAILAEPEGALCITPQGRFADPRERPVSFAHGLGHLAAELPGVTFVPLAVEYVYWEERLPEILARFGEPIRFADVGDSQERLDSLQGRLAAAQDGLADQSKARRADEFFSLLAGGAGVGGIYDLWRRGKSWLRGERFVAEHSASL